VFPSITVAPDIKFVPVSVIEKFPVPVLAGFVPASVGVGFKIVTALDALAEVTAVLVAVIVSAFGLGREAGAAKFPLAEIVPTAADPPAVPFTLQVTAVFEFPLTIALNCAVPPARTLAVDGVTVTVVEPEFEDPGSVGDVGLPVLLVVVVVFAIPPHAPATSAQRIGSICAACTAENLAERFAECIT
jgi:hypothetical protein